MHGACLSQCGKSEHSPYVGQGVPAGSQIVVAAQLADATLLSLHPRLCRRGGTGDHVMLVSTRSTGRRNTPAGTPARPATTRRGRFLRLVRSGNGVGIVGIAISACLPLFKQRDTYIYTRFNYLNSHLPKKKEKTISVLDQVCS